LNCSKIIGPERAIVMFYDCLDYPIPIVLGQRVFPPLPVCVMFRIIAIVDFQRIFPTCIKQLLLIRCHLPSISTSKVLSSSGEDILSFSAGTSFNIFEHDFWSVQDIIDSYTFDG
jgi:hypothetical protein